MHAFSRLPSTLPTRPRAVLAARGAWMVALAATVVACAGEGTAPETVASLVVSPSSATIASRAPLPLSASPRTAGGKPLSDRPVTWTSSDTAVARVSATGLVTAGAVLDGTPRGVTITASSQGVSGSAALTVTPAPVAAVTAMPSSASIAVGATQQYGTTLRDDLAFALSGRVVAWASSDTAVATVDATGLVTARPYGGGSVRTATITATSEGRSGSATVEVRPLQVALLSVAPDSVAVGDTRLLTATLTSAGGTPLWGRPIAWSSSDTTVARVNSAGLAIPAPRWDDLSRTVTITATADGVSGSTTLTVLPAAVGSIAIEPGSGSIASGGRDTLTGVARSLSGVELTGRTVTWSSANPALLSVDAQGILTAGLVTGGTAVPVAITATADGFSATATFAVLPSPVATVRLAVDSLVLYPRATSQLQATLEDASGSTLTGRAITWASGDPAIVEVSSAGLLTFLPYSGATTRETIVTATAEGRADTVRLVVRPNAVRNVRLSALSVALPIGATESVTAVMQDELGEPLIGRSLTWTSSDPSVASVSAEGVITMLGTGTAVITASADSASRAVRVGSLAAPLVPSTIIAGAYHHCGLTAAGAAYCWGYNLHGQLGNGTVTDATAPVAVVGGHAFVQLTAGAEFTCGITTTQQTYCWGENAAGQLGDGSGNHQRSPVLVVGGNQFTSITSGSFHACAIDAAGTAYCWGRNNLLQLGDGTNVDRFTPAPVLGGVAFTSLTARHGHTCGLTAGGVAYCWGRNQYGAIGDETRTNRSAPTLVHGTLTFTSLVAGWEHTCGRTSAGEVYCISRNQYGQGGNGTWVLNDTWVRTIGLPQVRTLHNGFYGVCAISFSDELYCWGRNRMGELTDGTVLDRNVPFRLYPQETFTNVAQAYSHSCAVVASGGIRCWGYLQGGLGYSFIEQLRDGGLPERRVATVSGRRSGTGRAWGTDGW